MELDDYCKLKELLGRAIYLSSQDIKMNEQDILMLIGKYKKCGGDMTLVQSYLNILSLYDDVAAKELMIKSTMLITIDNINKEIAWILRLQNYRAE